MQENDQNIHIIKFNRTPHNFMKLSVLEQLGSAIDKIVAHNDYEGLILMSAIDNIFISGHEVVDLYEENNDRKLKKYLRYIAEILLSIQRLNIPTLTIINGNCVGFGLELALCTDFRIASDGDINIGFPDTKLGTFPPFGGIYRLVSLIGETKARELLMKGRLLKPQTAVEWGLIDAITSQDNLMVDAQKLLKGISRHASLAMTAIKRSIVDATLKDFMSVIQEDIEDYTTIVRSYDYSEGKKALQENRIPEFKKK
jgi:enoyl-CoA hydratase